MRVRIQIIEDDVKNFDRPKLDKQADFAFLGHLKDNNLATISHYISHQLGQWQEFDQDIYGLDRWYAEAQNDEMIKEFEYETNSNSRE
jgi:hypothetical protein